MQFNWNLTVSYLEIILFSSSIGIGIGIDIGIVEVCEI